MTGVQTCALPISHLSPPCSRHLPLPLLLVRHLQQGCCPSSLSIGAAQDLGVAPQLLEIFPRGAISSAAGLAKGGGGRSGVGDQEGEDQRIGGRFVVVNQRVVKGNDRFSRCS